MKMVGPGLSISCHFFRRITHDRPIIRVGMTEAQVLLHVEVPNALPLILGGLRSATLQVVATATVAAYASLGGLGNYLIDGIKVREFRSQSETANWPRALANIPSPRSS